MYWFRTPPGIRVGRAALDQETIRLLEAHHPDVEFDWPQILNGEEEAPAPEERPVRPEPSRRPAGPVERGSAAVTAPDLPRPEAPAAAVARLGQEGIERLRARYADVVSSIAGRVADEGRRQELRSQAERLNPDAWTTDEEVTAGLEGYEPGLAALRDALGSRRRRRRPRRGDADATAEDAEREDPGSSTGG